MTARSPEEITARSCAAFRNQGGIDRRPAKRRTGTNIEGDLPQQSPDGKFLYCLKGDSYPASCSVWRMPVGGSEETKVLDSIHCAGHWAVWQRSIYFFGMPDGKGHSEIRLHEFATGKTRAILKIERNINEWIAVSADGRAVLYTQLDQAGKDLVLVENFR